jgi:hypothetical protein
MTQKNYTPSNSMEKGLFSEADIHSASEEIPVLFWNVKVQYRVHKKPANDLCP